MPEILDPAKFLALRKCGIPVLDVRSPGEFRQARIPGAHNLPLFDDMERAQVGTLYKQVSQDAAFIRGMEIAGPKMAGFIQSAMDMHKDRQIGIYCARGGKRSASMAWLMENAGFRVFLLRGGYKCVRQYWLDVLAQPAYRFVLLGGMTGSGKTKLLHAIRQAGGQVIDLEGLAHHKGSAFGAIPQKDQPALADFENQLADSLMAMNPSRIIWMEDESRFIGRIQLPSGIWDRMRQASRLILEVPFSARLKAIVCDYQSLPLPVLADGFRKIERKMGPQHARQALAFLTDGHLEEAARLALDYYDRLYLHHHKTHATGPVTSMPWDGRDPEGFAAKLLEMEDRTL